MNSENSCNAVPLYVKYVLTDVANGKQVDESNWAGLIEYLADFCKIHNCDESLIEDIGLAVKHFYETVNEEPYGDSFNWFQQLASEPSYYRW